MGVHKYRSVEDMPRPELARGDVAARVRAVWRRARALAPAPGIVRGVRKFRTIEEANAARDEERMARMRRSASGRRSW